VFARWADSGRFGLIEHDIVEPFAHKLPHFDHICKTGLPRAAAALSGDPVATALV
jgi:hypothetical protein